MSDDAGSSPAPQHHLDAVLAPADGLEAQGGNMALVAHTLRAMFRTLMAGPPEEAPATEAEAEVAAEHVDEPDVPGSAQDASAKAFDATVDEEAKATESPLAGGDAGSSDSQADPLASDS